MSISRILTSSYSLEGSEPPAIDPIRPALEPLPQSETPDTVTLPGIVDAAEVIAHPPDRPPELVSGLLHQGSKLVLGGSSKSFKTWCLLDLGVSIASGSPFWGFPTCKGRVLYINLEIQPAFFAGRVAEVCRARDVKLGSGDLSLWNLRGFATDYDQLRAEFEERLNDEEFAAIVIDPTYKVLGDRDENKAGEIAGLLNGFEALAVSTGAAVAFGAHFSKGNQSGKESIDRISGSGVFARDPDTILVLTKHEQEGAFTVEATLRNFKPVDPFVVQWQFPLMMRTNLNPSALKQVKTPTSKKVISALDVRALLIRPMSGKELKLAIKKKFGVSTTRAREAFDDAITDNAITHHGDAENYYLNSEWGLSR